MIARTLATALLLILPFSSASAQQADPRIPDGRALGFTIDRFRFVGEEEGGFTAFTFHITQLKRGGLGPDLAIGTFPQVLAAQHLTLNLDADAAFNISLPRVTILPRAGVSTIMIAGSFATGYSMGYNFGASVIVNFNARDAIRFDITRREYLQGNWLRQPTLTIGIGVSGVPSRRKGATQ